MHVHVLVYMYMKSKHAMVFYFLLLSFGHFRHFLLFLFFLFFLVLHTNDEELGVCGGALQQV